MIVGQVNSDLEALIPIEVYSGSGISQEVVAVIDTGFNGALTLPGDLIRRLGLTWRSRGEVMLADGKLESFDSYTVQINFQGQFRRILVEEVEAAPLVGMVLLKGYELCVEVRNGGQVRLTPLINS